jgi:uncharacterized membrane protein
MLSLTDHWSFKWFLNDVQEHKDLYHFNHLYRSGTKEAVMRKKMFVIPIIVVALVAFGTVSSANAFVGLTSLTVAIAAGFLTTVFAAETAKHANTESLEKEAKKQNAKKKTNDDIHLSVLKTRLPDEAK